MEKNKEKALNLLNQKINGEIKISYREITSQTGYQKRHLINLAKETQKRDIPAILIHGQTSKPSQ